MKVPCSPRREDALAHKLLHVVQGDSGPPGARNAHSSRGSVGPRVRSTDFPGVSTEPSPPPTSPQSQFVPLSREPVLLFYKVQEVTVPFGSREEHFLATSAQLPSCISLRISDFGLFWKVGRKYHRGGDAGAQPGWGQAGGLRWLKSRGLCISFQMLHRPSPIRDPHRICLEKVSCLEPAGYF